MTPSITTNSRASILGSLEYSNQSETAMLKGRTHTRHPSKPHLPTSDPVFGRPGSSGSDPNGYSRIVNQVERLVDSITRLIEAISQFNKSTKQDDAIRSPAQATGVAAQDDSISVQNEDTAQITPTDDSSTTAEDPVDSALQAKTPSNAVQDPCKCDCAPSKPAIKLGTLLPETGGFLWKPISDKDGELVILIPKQYTGSVKQVRILNPDGTESLAKGRYAGIGNGDREHYRFTKPGNAYPDGAMVLIDMDNGSSRHFRIKDTNKRTER